jgi:hypothetical protein
MIATPSKFTAVDSAVEMEGVGEEEEGDELRWERVGVEGLECIAIISILLLTGGG